MFREERLKLELIFLQKTPPIVVLHKKKFDYTLKKKQLPTGVLLNRCSSILLKILEKHL